MDGIADLNILGRELSITPIASRRDLYHSHTTDKGYICASSRRYQFLFCQIFVFGTRYLGNLLRLVFVVRNTRTSWNWLIGNAMWQKKQSIDDCLRTGGINSDRKSPKSYWKSFWMLFKHHWRPLQGFCKALRNLQRSVKAFERQALSEARWRNLNNQLGGGTHDWATTVGSGGIYD